MRADHELVASPRMSFSRAKHAKGGYPTKIAGDPGGHPRNRAESGTRSGIDDRKQCPCHGPIAEMRRSRFVLQRRSEEHTSELQSLMRISYAVFCLNKNRKKQHR